MTSKKKYQISFHIERKRRDTIGAKNLKEINLKEILFSNVSEEKENFVIYDYDSKLTINTLKEYFLLTFGKKYENCCPCVLFVYYLQSSLFDANKLILLSKDDNQKLSQFNYNRLYIIKRNCLCDCELKEYYKYMNMQKIDIIKELKNMFKIRKCGKTK